VVALHHNHGCTLARALESRKEGETQVDTRERFLKAFHLIVNNPDGLTLWDTPRGRYWIRTGAEAVFAHNLADQERGIYLAGGVSATRIAGERGRVHEGGTCSGSEAGGRYRTVAR